jgi:hypothetical protein
MHVNRANANVIICIRMLAVYKETWEGLSYRSLFQAKKDGCFILLA